MVAVDPEKRGLGSHFTHWSEQRRRSTSKIFFVDSALARMFGDFGMVYTVVFFLSCNRWATMPITSTCEKRNCSLHSRSVSSCTPPNSFQDVVLPHHITCHVLSCLVLSCLVLSCLVLSCLVLCPLHLIEIYICLLFRVGIVFARKSS